jgi:hypothetical protein
MIAFAHMLDNIAHSLTPILVLLALCGWIYGVTARAWASRPLMSWEPRNRTARFFLGLLVFGGIIASFFVFGAIIKTAAREEMSPRLCSRIGSATVNGRPFEQVDELAAVLRGIHDSPAHHSHPAKSYEVRVNTDVGPLTLRLCRDADNPHEYWVFYPGFHSTSLNEVGRTFTDLLDGR